MSVLVVVESSGGAVKKTSLEAVSYGASLSSDIVVLALGDHDASALGSLGAQGATKVLHDAADGYAGGDASHFARSIAKAAGENGSETILLATSPFTATVASRVAAKMDAALVTNIVDLPDTSSGYALKRSIFTGKAFEKVEVSADKKVLVLKKNAIEIKEGGGSASVESVSLSEGSSSVTVTGTEKVEGDVLLPEAEVVVSAGRGLKGPENWGMIEELAGLLGAATACSKPVSDMEWRPHHEHVGQTGIKISPQLYIAVGISGAIQHLAGVNSSKVIVVINKDPDAPFFNEADYGIVGDAFQVVPELINALKSN